MNSFNLEERTENLDSQKLAITKVNLIIFKLIFKINQI